VSIQGQAGAKNAAGHIKAETEKELAAAKSEEARAALERVRAKCQEIIEAAESGWY
jgi:uncharacterized protein (DUF849 family)